MSQDRINEEIREYIMKRYITRGKILSSRMGKTVTKYKSELYKIFSKYSKKEVDEGLESFDTLFNVIPKITNNEPIGYTLHGVKKVIIKDKKGWFS